MIIDDFNDESRVKIVEVINISIFKLIIIILFLDKDLKIFLDSFYIIKN